MFFFTKIIKNDVKTLFIRVILHESRFKTPFMKNQIKTNFNGFINNVYTTIPEVKKRQNATTVTVALP